MVKFLYEQNVIMIAFAVLGGLGLLSRFIVTLLYRHLVKESDNLGETKNKLLKHLKMKFTTCYKLKIGVNNVDTFVDKNVLKYHFCGVLLSTWENFCGQVLFAILLLVPVSTVFGVFYDCGQDQVILSGAVGILSASILIFVDKSMNLSIKKRMLRLNIMDYLENLCKVRLQEESVSVELLEKYRQEILGTSKGDKKGESGEELSRRREIRKQKEEEKRLQAQKREEEQKKLLEARREEEQRKLEERKLLAAKRREEELLRQEEERLALEARREKQKAESQQRQLANQQKKKLVKELEKSETEELLHSMEEELIKDKEKTDMKVVLDGIDEIAADLEKEQQLKNHPEQKQNVSQVSKAPAIDPQEEKLIEDVLREFFA